MLIIKAGDEVDKADTDALIAQHDDGVGLVIILRDFIKPLAPPTFVNKQEMVR
jgi:hypothetical protein